MTAHPIPANADHWWLCCGKWRRLHAIPETAITRERMEDAIDDNRMVPARAVCRLARRWSMPGIGSCLASPRCSACCQGLGIPPGRGTPANETHRKERREGESRV